MSDISENIVLLWGWKRRLCAALVGAATVLALPPVGLFPVVFATFPVLVWLMDGSGVTGRRGFYALVPAFGAGWWFGFGYFTAGLYWLGASFLVEPDKFAWALPLGVFGLPAVLALFTGAGAAVARLLWSGGPWRVLALAFGIGLSEVARGVLFTGFPWNSFGYVLTIFPQQMQIVSFIGIYGLTLLTILCAGAPATLFDPADDSGRRRLGPVIVAVLLLGVQCLFGFQRLQMASDEKVEGTRLRLVQPLYYQEDRLNPRRRDEIVERLIQLSSEPGKSQANLRGGAAPTHIIWPESTLPFLISAAPQVLSRFEVMLQPGQVLIAGLNRAEEGGAGTTSKRVYNSLYVFDADAKVINRYDKKHLVPFGEYIPFQGFFRLAGLKPLTQLSRFSSGARRELIRTPQAPPFLPLICYEVIFPGEIVETGDRPGWIVNISDDSWFGNTSGPAQHLHQARVRAVEEGLPIVRVTTTGISGVIDPYGRLSAIIGLGEEGFQDTQLPKALPATHFSKHPANVTMYLLIAFGLLSLLLRRGTL